MNGSLKYAVELTDEEFNLVNGGAGSSAKYYTVQKGDTLTRIANRFGTTVNRLLSLNPSIINNPNDIPTGAKIRVK